MNKAYYFIAFACGAVVGAVAMAYYNEKKSIEVVEAEDDPFEPEEETVEGEVVSEGQDMAKTFEEIATVNGYTQRDAVDTPPSVTITTHPYFIEDPEDFGTLEDYDIINLTLFSDGVLADDQREQMTPGEIVRAVGADYAKYFGEYEDDENTVYIRNDEYCCDYEICKDLRTYAEIDQERPHLKWRDDE